MTLQIIVMSDGRLRCVVFFEDGRLNTYRYTVMSWREFFAATGTAYLDDYNRVRVSI